MIKGFDVDISLGDKDFNLCEGEIFIIHVNDDPDLDLDNFEILSCDFVGCLTTDFNDLFIFDSKHGFIKIDSLCITDMFLDKGIYHLYCDSYKVINL